MKQNYVEAYKKKIQMEDEEAALNGYISEATEEFGKPGVSIAEEDMEKFEKKARNAITPKELAELEKDANELAGLADAANRILQTERMQKFMDKVDDLGDDIYQS